MMKRTQIYIDTRQWAQLQKAARRSKRTVSDLIRQAIDAQLTSRGGSAEFFAALRQGAFGIWGNRTDLVSTDAYVRRLRRGTRLDRLFQ